MVDMSFDLRKIEATLRKAIEKGLSTSKIKTEVTKLAVVEIEKVVEANQDLFRPDRGPGGGDDLIGFLGIGQGGSPLTEKYAGRNAAWALLNPGINQFVGAARLSASFSRARQGKFASLTYTIDTDRFFNHFRSTYLSRKSGDSDIEISWMQGLIDGVPTEQLRDYPGLGGEFIFVDSGPNFNRKFSRTGLGTMVREEKLRIPARQFIFGGRGRQETFGVLLEKLNKSLASARFKNKVEKVIAKSINSGGR